jgi:hypothetical protein
MERIVRSLAGCPAIPGTAQQFASRGQSLGIEYLTHAAERLARSEAEKSVCLLGHVCQRVPSLVRGYATTIRSDAAFDILDVVMT